MIERSHYFLLVTTITNYALLNMIKQYHDNDWGESNYLRFSAGRGSISLTLWKSRFGMEEIMISGIIIKEK